METLVKIFLTLEKFGGEGKRDLLVYIDPWTNIYGGGPGSRFLAIFYKFMCFIDFRWFQIATLYFSQLLSHS